MKRLKLIGEVYGRLTVLRDAGTVRSAKGRARMLVCLCSCGEETIARLSDLRSGGSKSCGCLRRELKSARDEAQRKNCFSHQPEYGSWAAMMNRCYNPAFQHYRYYGGRGITVCDSWKNSFQEFLRQMGPRPSNVHTLGRINNDGNYDSENVVWETRIEQMNNTRGNRLVTHLGETMTVAQWAKRIGIPAQILYTRLHRKWPIDRALGQEVRR